MSLYYETANALSPSGPTGSLKSRVFNTTKPTGKSQPKQIYALASETVQWSPILAEVIENAQLLELERKLSPELALLLVHDFLLAKRGISAPTSHPLREAIGRHKARIQAEFVKARLRRGCSSVDELLALLRSAEVPTDATPLNGYHHPCPFHPRWIRINTLKTSLEEQLQTTFAGHKHVEGLNTLARPPSTNSLCIDYHIPDLLALPISTDLTKLPAYREGKIILQDKASCFPAYLLDPTADEGDIVDACAAPGNKTTHLAAILRDHGNTSKVTIHACERDNSRASALTHMLSTAGAHHVEVHAGQDFLKADITKPPWNCVRSLLLDPSCSGSGIVGRDEPLNITFPQRRTKNNPLNTKKRKREVASEHYTSMHDAAEEDLLSKKSLDELKVRLQALSAFQLKVLLHGFQFLQARKIVYSTCSIYAEENEQVVVKGLLSDIAQKRGWRMMRRVEQPDGLRKWSVRGNYEACAGYIRSDDALNAAEIADGCIRCEKGTKDGTQGFFVAGFVRDRMSDEAALEDEWEGFSEPD